MLCPKPTTITTRLSQSLSMHPKSGSADPVLVCKLSWAGLAFRQGIHPGLVARAIRRQAKPRCGVTVATILVDAQSQY
jgi:hypothetical protein